MTPYPGHELECRLFPATTALYGGYLPFHDSHWNSMEFSFDGATATLRVEWFFNDMAPNKQEDIHSLSVVEFRGVQRMAFGIHPELYTDFGDGSMVEREGGVEIRLLESGTGLEWVLLVGEVEEVSCRETGRVPI